MNELKVYIDLDSVCVNFNKAIYQTFGKPDNIQPMKKASQHLNVTTIEFWDIIDSYGEDFWAYMEKEEWCDELIEAVEKFDKDWCFLTAVPLSSYAASGKMRWIKYNFGRHFFRFIITTKKMKARLANRNSVLIDDDEQNYKDFVNAGGNAILFPRYHNKNYKFRDIKIQLTKHMLTIIKESING